MRKIVFFLLITCLTFNSYGQDVKKQRQLEKRQHINTMVRQEEEGVITYKKSFVFGAKLTTDGYGVFFELGRASSVKKATLYQLEISERKHVKEDKVNSYYSNSVPYIYGKENFFYPVKLGVQRQILLGNKSNKNGVSVTGNYGGGISAGLLRPYYIQVQQGNTINYIKFNSADSSDFLNGKIYGGPSFGKGWSDMTVVPGLYAKAAVRFDYGSYNEIVSAIEVGVSGEYYTKKIPQMVYNTQKQFFLSAYVAILFGKRK
ncbi:MAG: hypothetical protein Q8891_15585 [Bacteroidota bacterium]|nr:hypothetical protein [Bacteroidota bacterium]